MGVNLESKLRAPSSLVKAIFHLPVASLPKEQYHTAGKFAGEA